MMILDCIWRNVLPLLFTQLAQHISEPADSRPSEVYRPNEIPASLDGLLPDIELDLYRSVDVRILLEKYGPISPENHQNRSWNLLSQDTTFLPSFLEHRRWDCEAFFEEDRAVFLGTVPDPMWNLEVWFQGKELKYGAQTPDDLRGVVSRDIQYGRFSASHELVVMVEERRKADISVFRIHAAEEESNKPPALLNDMWTTLPSIISFPYKSAGDGASETHVSISYDSGDRSLIWTLTSWTAGFAEQMSFHIVESQTPAPPNTTLLDGDTIVRAFYRPSSNSSVFKLETLQIESLGSVHSPEIKILSSQTFPMTWNASSRYTSFSILPSTDDRGSSMVVLLEDPETAALSTLVFPRDPTSGFLPPTVSPVKIPEGDLTFTAPFLKTLRVQQTPYINRETEARAQGGLLQLFDNFGLLGARLLAPISEDGGLSYEVVGQDPALAGQASDVIGWRFKQA